MRTLSADRFGTAISSQIQKHWDLLRQAFLVINADVSHIPKDESVNDDTQVRRSKNNKLCI